MNYNEWMKEQYLAKMHKKTVTGRIKSETVEKNRESVQKATKRTKNANIVRKPDKNEIKAMNDAELARRASLYGYIKPTESTPNPNTAFRHKKSQKRLFGDEAIPYLGNQPKNNFVVPDRYRELHDDMIARGNSVQYTIVCIKDYIAGEVHEDDAKVPAAKAVKQAVSDHLDKVHAKKPSSNELVRSKVRTKQWNPRTEHWEDEKPLAAPPSKKMKGLTWNAESMEWEE